jgi:hypothetical protein
MIRSAGSLARICQPSTLHIVIWPEASNTQNSMETDSAQGSRVQWAVSLPLSGRVYGA